MSTREFDIRFAGAVVLGALIFPHAALAGDVRLLKQGAFPIVITEPGSYRLRSNLVVPDANTSAIRLDADGVTIDLNGYSIVGPTVCAGVPVVCTGAGGGDGITSGSGGNDVTVLNGTIRGMGNDGMNLGDRARVERVRATGNGNNGIGAYGNSILSDNVAVSNGNYGIALGGSSVVSRNTAFGNATTGMNLADWTVVTGNTASFNLFHGISCGESCTLTSNVVHHNGTGVGSGAGIYTTINTVLIGNTATDNLSGGLEVGAGSGYANNVVNGNHGGNAFQQVYGNPLQTGTNVCGGDTTCP